jgi:hypothetical protein
VFGLIGIFVKGRNIEEFFFRRLPELGDDHAATRFHRHSCRRDNRRIATDPAAGSVNFGFI